VSESSWEFESPPRHHFLSLPLLVKPHNWDFAAQLPPNLFFAYPFAPCMTWAKWSVACCCDSSRTCA